MVRSRSRATAAGVDKPADAVEYTKWQFGLEITAQHFSSDESQLKSKGGLAGNRTQRSARSHAFAAGGNGMKCGGGGQSPAELARRLEALAEADGAEAVSDMLIVFADA